MEPRRTELDCISHRNRRKAKLKIAPAELRYIVVCGLECLYVYLSNNSTYWIKVFELLKLTGASGFKKYPSLQHYQRKKNMTALVHFPPQNKQLNWSISYHTPDLLPLIPCVGHKKSDMVSNVKLTCFFLQKKLF